MLLIQDSSSQRRFSIVIKYGHNSLRDDWTTIKSVVNEMHGTAAKFCAMLDCLLLRVESRK